jgi:penicillin-binding protein 2
MRLSDQYNVAEFRTRALVIAGFFAFLLLVLLSRLWYLQVMQGDIFREFSDQNRFKFEKLSAPRGQILDRHGALIADSRPRFNITYTRGYADDLKTEMAMIGDILLWSEEEVADRVERISRLGRYRAMALAEDISQDQLALLQLKSLQLPGLDVEVQAVRDYLYDDAFFHVLGYTGQINDRDLKRLQTLFPERNYVLGDQRGISGIEALQESVLRGRDGRNFVVVDVKGRKVNQEQWELLPETQRIDPQAGTDLRLSLDLGLQLEAVRAFGDQRGAVVAMDPRTGEILAYVSRPAFDPNIFTRVISTKEFAEIQSAEDNPFLDRVLGEHYPPGSTYKLVMAAAGLENGVIDAQTTHYCPGSFRFGRRSWGCHKRDGHGRMNIVQAIERSCDVFFYNLALGLGLDSMFSWSVRFGFGRRTFLGSEVLEPRADRVFRFNSEQPGFIPYEDWVRSRRNTSVEGETINAGIGQGAYLTTMMQLARMTSALGNGGKIWQPQLILSEVDSLSATEVPKKARVENQIQLHDEARRIVLKGMQEVVMGEEGTARASRLPGLVWGGKTGTAQVVNLEVWRRRAKEIREFEDHALFVGLAPMENPQIAIAVIVENGGQGSRVAAPIAKKMVDYYLRGTQTTEGLHGITNNKY